MPDIPALTQFTAGTAAHPDDFNENFYNAVGAAPTSLEVVNGWLSVANLASAAASITTRMVQRGELSKGKQVGKTADLDYLWEMWPNTASATRGDWRVIPGLGVRFYLRFAPTITLFTWSVLEANTRPETAGSGALQWEVFIDDTPQVATQRDVCSGFNSAGTGLLDGNTRVYSGHYGSTTLAAGWHNASLRLNMLDSTGLDHIRLHARSFRVMWFK